MIRKSACFTRSGKKGIALTGLITTLLVGSVASAQDRDRDGERDRDRDRIARLDPGTVIPVRTNQYIDSDKGDNRVYSGTVDQDVRGDNGRIVLPRGARVEMMVRVAPDNDLTLDLESVVVNGQRYGVRSEPKHIEERRDERRNDSVIGGIVGAITGGEARGREVRVPRDTVVTFRLQRPLELGAPDRGIDRNGQHFHDNDEHPNEDRNR
jgi:hypothetical protein